MAKTFKPLTRTVIGDGAEFLPDDLKKWAYAANELQHIVLTHAAQGMTIKAHTHHFKDGSWKYESHPDHVPLVRDYLTDQIGKDAVNAILPWMLENGYLERTSHYDRDVHAYGYKLGPTLAGKPHRRIKVSDTRFLKRHSDFQHANMKNWSKAHRHRRNWSKRIDVNLLAMRDAIRHLPDDTKSSVDVVLDMIETGDLNWRVCDYGRFHDVFTCLMSDLRAHLSYRGAPLVNIDIANSQPFILGSLILGSYSPAPPRAGVTLDQISHLLSQPDPGPREGGTSLTPHLVPIRRGKGGANDRKPLDEQEDRASGKTPEPGQASGAPGDLLHYIGLCQRGRLYEYLMAKTGYADKRAFKDEVWFHFLYGTNKKLERCRGDATLVKLVPLIELFTAEFPTVYEYMWRAKERNYRRLPCEMQRLESRIMIDTVIGWLAENEPAVPLLSIHDSILTTPENVPLVQRLIGVAFEAHGFLRPTVNVEYPADRPRELAAAA